MSRRRTALVGALLILGLVAVARPAVAGACAIPPPPVSVTVSDGAFSPSSATIAQRQSVSWSFANASAMSVTDSTGMGLFNTGPRGSSYSFSYLFNFAGGFPYHSTTASGGSGVVHVRMTRSPSSGTLATTFTIGWACAVRSGFVSDIEVRSPGGVWKWWRYGQTATSASFHASKTGWWQFRSRERRVANGAFSRFSPVLLVHVT